MIFLLLKPLLKSPYSSLTKLIMSDLISRIFVSTAVIAVVSLLIQFAFPSLTDKQAIVIGSLVNLLYYPARKK